MQFNPSRHQVRAGLASLFAALSLGVAPLLQAGPFAQAADTTEGTATAKASTSEPTPENYKVTVEEADRPDAKPSPTEGAKTNSLSPEAPNANTAPSSEVGAAKTRTRRAAEDPSPEPPVLKPGQQGVVERGKSLVTYRLTLDQAGVGQDPSLRGSRCIISTENGYPIGDESPTDNNVCAGGLATYHINLNAKTKEQGISFKLRPEWIRTGTLLGNESGSIIYPTHRLNQAKVSGLGVSVNPDGSWQVDIQPNMNVSAEFTIDVSTTEPRRTSGNTSGSFQLHLNGTDWNNEPMDTVVSDKDLNVLAIARLDQSITSTFVDPAEITINNKRYIGLTAYSDLTHTWNMSEAWLGGGYSTNGQIYRVAMDQISRYTLEIPTSPDGLRLFSASDVIVQYDDGKFERAQVDDNGNPYVQGRYASGIYNRVPFKIYVPTENLSRTETNKLVTRLDVVDKNGNFTKVKVENGSAFDVPALVGHPFQGDNQVDPGSNQSCDTPTADKSLGVNSPRAGKWGMPNNNCAKLDVNLKVCKLGEAGCSPTFKDDYPINGRSLSIFNNPKLTTFIPDSFVANPQIENRAPLSNAFVELTVSNEDATNNPSICVAWKPGTQVMQGGSGFGAKDFISINGSSYASLVQAFPFAQIYVTSQDVMGADNSPDCTNPDQWKLIYQHADPENPADTKENIEIAPASAFGSMKKISGFMIKLPGEPALTRPLTIRYRASLGDPNFIIANSPRLIHEDNQVKIFYPGNKTPVIVDPNTPGYKYEDGKKFYITTNALRVSKEVTYSEWDEETHTEKPVTKEVWTDPYRNHIVLPSAIVGTRGSNAGTLKANNVGSTTVDFYSVPAVTVQNGVNVALNKNDDDGNPNQYIARFYLSKCLRPNLERSSPGEQILGPEYTYVGDGYDISDPSDCSISLNNYIERRWSLGDEPNLTDDPNKDPFFPKGWVAQNSARPSVNFQDWNRRLKLPLNTPPWASPGMKFDVLDVYRVTGMPYLKEIKDGKLIYSTPAETAKLPQESAYEVETPGTATQSVIIPSISVLTSNKSVSDQVVPIEGTFRHEVTVMNSTNTPFGSGQLIDVLPYRGDHRETDYFGEYWLKQIPSMTKTSDESLDEESTPKIYYTTDDPTKVSMCPTNADENDIAICKGRAKRAIDKTPTLDTNWQLLTQEAIEAQDQPGAKHITALRFDIPKMLSENTYTFGLTFQTWANHNADRYVNSFGTTSIHMSGFAPGQSSIPDPEKVSTKAYASLISGRVYLDRKRTGDFTDGDLPLEGYKLRLLHMDGTPVLGAPCTPALTADGQDSDEDHCMALTEPGPDGTPVIIRNTDGQPMGRQEIIQVTDASGDYQFYTVPKGDFKIELILKNKRERVLQAGTEQGNTFIENVVVKGIPSFQNGGRMENVQHNDFGLVVVADLIVKKLDGNNAPVKGAEFKVFNDKDGNVGGLYTSPTIEGVELPNDGQPAEAASEFTWRDLTPGTWYWLAETKAPTGHELMAQPVRFKLSPQGEVTFGDGLSDFITKDKGLGADKVPFGVIKVRDVEAGHLPASGGRGIIWALTAGSLLLGAAIVLRRRSAMRN
ncbi:hypothetical protein BSR29_06805 [Boudabousia liubingyangii]|uniref:SpaA-like prealbumin fold domain-containing protein n=1 Tax=Boudabousia liubingyangii TaxID=1921764 RepID=A0A1Q5PKZ9_9ACTO|nr:SpaA isopeptide-forming pilin-related protein [Boudabousia liubingyangii]OKL47315.1 hypothetical protein BSR29_06805 [Boudabousia liubingyangii]